MHNQRHYFYYNLLTLFYIFSSSFSLFSISFKSPSFYAFVIILFISGSIHLVPLILGSATPFRAHSLDSHHFTQVCVGVLLSHGTPRFHLILVILFSVLRLCHAVNRLSHRNFSDQLLLCFHRLDLFQLPRKFAKK